MIEANHVILRRDNMAWSYLCPPVSRTRNFNQMPAGLRPGPIGGATQPQLTKKDTFLLLFIKDMQDTIILYTNEYAKMVNEAHNHVFRSDLRWAAMNKIVAGLYWSPSSRRNRKEL